MKKVLSVVLAVAMVLACVASLAFVLDNQTGIPTATNSALNVEGIHVTDEAAMVAGVKVYSELANLNDNLYAKNTIIRFAIDLAVKNPYYDRTVEPTKGNVATLILESDTVDFRLNQQQPYTSMVLYKPYYLDGIITTNLVNVVANEARYEPYVSEDNGTMKINVRYRTAMGDGSSMTLENASNWANFENTKTNQGLVLVGVSDNVTTVKTDYTLVVTGVAKGELNQEGLVTLSMQDKAGDTFDDDTKGVVKVEKNDHTYVIKKYYDTNKKSGAYSGITAIASLKDAFGEYGLQWTSRMTTNYGPSELVDVDAVGYEVFILLDDKGDNNESNDVYGLIGMFETEQVRTGALYGEGRGQDLDNTGMSLGLSYLTKDSSGESYVGVDTVLVSYTGPEYVLRNGGEVYRASNPDYLYGYTFDAGYQSSAVTQGIANTADDNNGRLVGYMTARTALNTFMSDFGFGIGNGYNYKVVDANFTNEATFEELGRATYNGNAIVVPQPDEDDDVEEGTGEEEIPDEGDIGEELPDEGDIDEEPIPDEPVPETGDASAAVAVALTAAALVAAAGLAVVLKKAR